MLRYLLDTNICIYVIKNRPPALREKFNRESPRMAISMVALMELYFGAEKSVHPKRNRDVIEAFAARLQVLDYGAKAALHTAEIRAALAAAGTPIGTYDVMIAGHGRSEGLIMVTNNRREFDRVDGLQIENWLDDAPA
ncbi:MAG: type II toxin-antitoxin system tRNA(fMet)-specific endonuclease VapC [Aestuariivirgaceae bacterium]